MEKAKIAYNGSLLFKLRNWISHLLKPTIGQCLCCGGHWNVVRGHVTTYLEEPGCSLGCFPLCESCWKKLGTPAERLPYYRELYENNWNYEPEEVWLQIEAAVREGK